MSQVSKPNTSADLTTFMRLFGRPPLLSNEKLEHFAEMMNRLVACMQPDDFLVSIFVYQIAIEPWCTIRWKRYQTLMINRWESTARDFKAQRAKLREQLKATQKDPSELIKDAKTEADRGLYAKLRLAFLTKFEQDSNRCSRFNKDAELQTADYLDCYGRLCLRSHRPGLPRFSSINSTPTASKVRRRVFS